MLRKRGSDQLDFMRFGERADVLAHDFVASVRCPHRGQRLIIVAHALPQRLRFWLFLEFADPGS